MFDTFEQSLAASLQAPFRKIVAEQCDIADFVDLNGKHVTATPRGRVLSVFKAVAIAWLRLYAIEEDAYEVSLRWLQNHVLLNMDKVPVEVVTYWVKEINELLTWCPSCKNAHCTRGAARASKSHRV